MASASQTEQICDNTWQSAILPGMIYIKKMRRPTRLQIFCQLKISLVIVTLFRYKCNVCNREFSDSSSRRRHEEIHSGKRKYKCSFCDYASFQKANLDRHLKLHSNKDENLSQPKPGSLWFENSKGDCFICTLCSYKTKQKSALNKHLKTMHKKLATNPKYRGNHFSSEAASQKDNGTCDPQQ